MKPLRAAALVMFAIAAVDLVLVALKWIISRFTGTEMTALWPIMLATGVLMIILDMVFDPRTAPGRYTRHLLERLGHRFRHMLSFLGATTFGSGVVREDQPKPKREAESMPKPKETEPYTPL